MSINTKQLTSLVTSVLYDLDVETDGKIPVTPAAADLLLLTAAHESHLGTYLRQVKGPALGIFQMEPTTHKDHWIYIGDRKWLRDAFGNLGFTYPEHGEMEWNLKYAILMARVHYYRKPEPLPNKKQDGEDYHIYLASYAKNHYNTVEGKATWKQYLDDYLTFVVET